MATPRWALAFGETLCHGPDADLALHAAWHYMATLAAASKKRRAAELMVSARLPSAIPEVEPEQSHRAELWQPDSTCSTLSAVTKPVILTEDDDYI